MGHLASSETAQVHSYSPKEYDALQSSLVDWSRLTALQPSQNGAGRFPFLPESTAAHLATPDTLLYRNSPTLQTNGIKLLNHQIIPDL